MIQACNLIGQLRLTRGPDARERISWLVECKSHWILGANDSIFTPSDLHSIPLRDNEVIKSSKKLGMGKH